VKILVWRGGAMRLTKCRVVIIILLLLGSIAAIAGVSG